LGLSLEVSLEGSIGVRKLTVKTSLAAIGTSAVRFWRQSLKAELIRTFRAHTPFIALVLIYAAATYVTAAIYGVADKVRLSLYSSTLVAAALYLSMLFFVVYASRVILFTRPQHPMRYIMDDLMTRYLKWERIVIALPVIIFLPIFMSAFTSFKSMVPIIHPFCWDATLAKWDAAVHGGVQPWRLLQPVLGHPLVTSAISVLYALWFLTMFGVLYWQILTLHDPQTRQQFLLTYMLCWMLIGTLAAIIFSSAGPCYYGRLVQGTDIYKPLMQYLRSANESYPVLSLDPQEMLWGWYQNRETGFVSGISAMPSMHVSIAVLFVLVGWRKNRKLGMAFSLFAALIMVGCVHLGWHYAIDGYAAVVGTLLIWWAVGWLLKRYATGLTMPYCAGEPLPQAGAVHAFLA
jgi:PAP2 superfamily